jgi:hypothetical protein
MVTFCLSLTLALYLPVFFQDFLSRINALQQPKAGQMCIGVPQKQRPRAVTIDFVGVPDLPRQTTAAAS